MKSLFKRKGTSNSSSAPTSFFKSTIDNAENQVLDNDERRLRLQNQEDKRTLWIQSRKYVIMASLAIIGFLVTKFLVAGDKDEAESIKKSGELELIENKIIIGIEEKSDKILLLDLIAKLNHDDNDNYITGKKQGIILSDINSPEEEFYGTFSEYWTGIREAYKDIIMKGITIEEYKNELIKMHDYSSLNTENEVNENTPSPKKIVKKTSVREKENSEVQTEKSEDELVTPFIDSSSVLN